MFTFTINNDNGMPLYHQLYSFIKEEIQSGRLACDTKLPSKRKLSEYMSVSQNTIQAAYDQLIEEGYISSFERKGFYVCKIDNLQKLQVKNEKGIKDSEPALAAPRYDFSYHGVDNQAFPFNIWRRLYKEVIDEYDPELLKLGDSFGLIKLRTVIADYLHQSRGVNCTKDQVIISSGTELLFQSLIQLFDRDFVYGIENPGYEKLNQLFTANRAAFKAIDIDAGGMIPKEVVESGVNIICITPAHQFPSGEIMPISRRINLLNWADAGSDRYIVEDDYDSEFKYSGKPVPALQGLDSGEKVIYMGSLSKSLSPTIRVSYMALPPHLIRRYREKLSYILCPVPVMEQKALYRFILDGYFERHLNKMRNIYKKKREALVEAVREMDNGIKLLGADAGLHLLLHVENGMSEEELIASAHNMGVRVYGISKYYFKDQKNTPPAVLLGYASMTEGEIRSAVGLLYKAWFK